MFFPIIFFVSHLIYPILSQVNCNFTGKWFIVSLPKEQMFHLLPPGVFFDDHHYKDISSDHHPLLLEFNYIHDCWFYYLFPSPNMHEFKIEVPFTMTTNGTQAMTKSLVLSDSWLSTNGAKFFYGLQAVYSDYSGDLFSYNISSKAANIDVKSSFQYSKKPPVKLYEAKYMEESYKKFNKAPWFTDYTAFDADSPNCAKNIYKWDLNSTVRYVNASIQISMEKFNHTFKVPSQEDNFFGGVEVEGEVFITNRTPCQSFFREGKIADL